MTRLVTAIAAVAPFLALVPTAYLVAWRTMQHLGWPLWVAVAAALAVEALGLAVAVTALDLYSYNRAKRKSDPAAPMALPIALLAVYFASAEALTVGLDIATGPASFAKWTQAVFPVLGLAGMVTLAARYDHEQRKAEVKAEKAEEKAERDEINARRRAARAAKKAQLVQPVAVQDATLDIASKEGMVAYITTKSAKVRELAGLHPDWNLMQLATFAHCSVSTASRALASGNGNGHERIGVAESR